VYVFASANPAVFKLDRKHEDTLVLYMPLFDLEELQLCRREVARFSTIRQEDVAAAFALVGGIARLTLLSLSRKRPLRELRDMVYSKVQLTRAKDLEVRRRHTSDIESAMVIADCHDHGVVATNQATKTFAAYCRLCHVSWRQCAL
jgi:hypothetical protein